jgi:hypothetical protein
MEPLDPELQSLVTAERGEVEPSAADRQRVARSLAPRVGAGFAVGLGLVSAPAAGAAAAGAGTGLLLKVGAAVALAGTVAALTVPNWWGEKPLPAGAPPVTPTAAPVVSAATLAPESAVTAAPTPTDPVPERAPPASARADSGARPPTLPPLAEEARLLRQAQQALRDGQAGAALAALSEHQQRFPRGQLSLERSAARIQALCGLGRKQQAEREAKAFLQQHAGSGLAAQVRASCGFAAPSP